MTKKRTLDKKDIRNIILILLAYAVIVVLLTHFKYCYGSRMDWAAQHYNFPDYFRKLFYKTGQLIPSFAANIGAGENIFSMSYYGLLSPIILLSYCLPFVDMATYIMAISIIGVAVDTVLFYWWARKKFSSHITFVLTVMLTFSAALIFHSHRHIMFVSYIPFLILGLHFVEVYFDKGRRTGLIICCFLILMTNYFFSVSALCCLVIYGVYCWLKKGEDISLKGFFKKGMPFALLFIVAALMACVLLMPTAYTILSGRDETNTKISILELLPQIRLSYIVYGAYSLGLSAFTIVSIIWSCIQKDKAKRFIGIVFAIFGTCPFVIFALNAGMYIDAKILIPFAPLALLLCGYTLTDIFAGKFKMKTVLIVFAIVSVVGLIFYHGYVSVRIKYAVDFVLTVALMLIFAKTKKKYIITLPFMAMIMLVCVQENFTDKLISIDSFEKQNNSELIELVNYATENEDDSYRIATDIDCGDTVNKVYTTEYYQDTIYSSVHNRDYNHFYFEEMFNENSYRNSALTTRSKNLIFNLYMGDKYWITTGGYIPSGYSLVKTSGRYSLYENENCLTVGYATSKIMGMEEYRSLSYPQSVEALLNYTIVDDYSQPSGFKSQTEKIDVSDLFDNSSNVSKTDDGYIVDAKKRFFINYKLNEELIGKTVMLKFKVDNTIAQSNDVKIIINGIANKLTDANWKYFNHNNSFEYVITDANSGAITELSMDMTAGKYKIYDIEAYTIDTEILNSVKDSTDEFVTDTDKTQGDDICGTVNASADGYFNMSVPYCEGFTVYVDGEKTDYEKVDTSFIGFKLAKGKHDIKITFTAPWLSIGKIASLAGFILLVGAVILDIRDKKKQK